MILNAAISSFLDISMQNIRIILAYMENIIEKNRLEMCLYETKRDEGGRL